MNIINKYLTEKEMSKKKSSSVSGNQSNESTVSSIVGSETSRIIEKYESNKGPEAYNTLYGHSQKKGGKFENEMEGVMADIVKFLKKEYKAITKNTLSLKPLGEVDIFVQPVSRTRTDLRMYQEFEISSLDKKAVIAVGLPSEDTTRDITRKFLAMGREKAKKPSNVTRPDEKKKD